MDARQIPPDVYDIQITGIQDWEKLSSRSLDIIVDPFLLRIGQFFLEGKEAGPERWTAIESDLGALVAFVDLVVMRDQIPAFNYPDTFDYPHIDQTSEFRDNLGNVLNAGGDKTLVHVDVEHYMYRDAKEAAVGQLNHRLDEGPFVPQAIAAEILGSLEAVQYQWEPRLEGGLDERLPDPLSKQLARFLLGQLVFTGYSQQTGALHITAPRRSRYLASVGLSDPAVRAFQQQHGLILPTGLASQERWIATTEREIYDELRRRCRGAGAGWRSDNLPWEPSFLPYILKGMNPYKEGPDILLQRAKDLRSTKAVRKYRNLRNELGSIESARSAKARKYLQKAADRVADELNSSRGELEFAKHVVVEVSPKALGAVGGAFAGTLLAGPAGGILGAAGGVVTEEALAQVSKRLWGWVIDRLPFFSARKLLARSVHAEHEIKDQLGVVLGQVWESRRA